MADGAPCASKAGTIVDFESSAETGGPTEMIALAPVAGSPTAGQALMGNLAPGSRTCSSKVLALVLGSLRLEHGGMLVLSADRPASLPSSKVLPSSLDAASATADVPDPPG